MRALSLLALAVVTSACGSTIILPPTTDAGTPPADQGATGDAAPATDGGVGTDAPATTDAALPSLNGRWRLRRFEVDGDDGARRTLTDVDQSVPTPTGEMTIARANGVLVVADDRLASAAGTLINGHFYTLPMGYSANGFGAAGLLDQSTGRFMGVGGGGGLTLRRDPEGTITITGDSFGTTAVTYERAPSTARVDRLSATGLAMIREMTTAPAGLSLRVALFWDLIGAVPDVETNGYALRFTGRFAQYPVVLGGAPPENVRVRVGVATVALARVAIYVDTDGNLAFDRTVDRPVAISPVGIAWRDDTAAVDSTNTPVRDLTPGYQYVHIHGDSGLGRPAVTPYDNANLVSPDIPIALSMSATPVIPDVF